MAVGQFEHPGLTHRYRGQAPSHIESLQGMESALFHGLSHRCQQQHRTALLWEGACPRLRSVSLHFCF